jgi:hypothetical protein
MATARAMAMAAIVESKRLKMFFFMELTCLLFLN